MIIRPRWDVPHVRCLLRTFHAWPCLLRQVGTVLGSPCDCIVTGITYANPGSRHVLGQRVDKKLNVIHYASKTLDSAQKKYATTEKEFSAVVFACDKFRKYIVDSKVTIHTDHAAIKYLMKKNDVRPRLIIW